MLTHMLILMYANICTRTGHNSSLYRLLSVAYLGFQRGDVRWPLYSAHTRGGGANQVFQFLYYVKKIVLVKAKGGMADLAKG